MNRIIHKLVITALAFISANAFAQTITIGTGSGSATDVVTIPVNFATGSQDIGNFTIDVAFDASKFSSAVGDCSVANVSQTATSCSDAAGLIRITMTRGSGALTTGLAANLVMTIADPAAAGLVPLNGSMNTIGFGGADLPLDTITVTDGELTIVGPAYTSAPTPAQGVDLGSVIQGGTDPTAPVLITNTGAVGTTLTVTGCSITSNPSLFSVDSEAQFTVDQGSAGVTRTVSCRASGAIQVHNGVMTCNHDGGAAGEATPAVYALSCAITAGPQPAYSSNPADGTPIAMGPVEQDDPIVPEDVAISNSGDTGTTLTGTCSITGDVGKITVADGSFSVLQGGATDIQTVSCDSSEAGNYAATLTCEHDGSNPTATYDVTCEVGPAGGAIFRSDPDPNSTTPIGVDVVVEDTPDPTAPLQFFNDADVGDMDLDIACSITAGGAPISVLPDISAGIQISPQSSAGVDFTCDTSAAGNYSVTYSCDYTVDGTSLPAGNGGIQQEIYTYTCDVRDPVSDVDPTPASGTTLPVVIDSAGGTGSTMVEFTEGADEGVNGALITPECSLADGTHYEITAPLPGDYPVAIAAGDPVMVTVEGTDPDDGSSPTDTLTCTYTDSANTEGVDVTYPLTMELAGAGAARFAVTKTFADDHDADVTVTLTCDTGLPLQQSFDISPGDPVEFVVTSFEDGLMDCVVTEGDADAYLTNYAASGDSQSVDDDPDAPGCHFLAVTGGDSNFCDITNAAEPVDVVIEKEWVIDGAVSDEVNEYYQLTLYCDSLIIGGTPSNGNGNPMSGTQSIVPGHWYKVFNGMGNEIFIAEVVPDYPSTSCWVDEDVSTMSGIEVDNGCMDIEVSAGNGAYCKITNTVFFEGIPTLSQYGLALMALLMLGVGMVGFRRFA